MEIANAVGTTSGAPRTSRVVMEGVGARVIRGPDWKWGKQVRITITINCCHKNRKHAICRTVVRAMWAL